MVFYRPIFHAQAPVVEKLDRKIHHINHYPAETRINRYLVDSAIRLLKTTGDR